MVNIRMRNGISRIKYILYPLLLMPSPGTASLGPPILTSRPFLVAAVILTAAAIAIQVIRSDFGAGWKVRNAHPREVPQLHVTMPGGKDQTKVFKDLALEQVEGYPVVVIVGSGLAGMAAALESVVTDPTVRVIVLEKEARVGGNSAKASSGINAVASTAGDSIEAFIKDTVSSGGTNSCDYQLVETLVEDSEAGLQWLSSFGVDLNSSVKLGGHSHARTRYPSSGRPVGATIIGRLKEAVDKEPRIRIITQANVSRLSYSDKTNSIDGLYFYYTALKNLDSDDTSLKKDIEHNKYFLPAKSIVLASGGFAANTELMRQVAPDVASLPTTNGPWAQGDGLLMARDIGAAITNLSLVQVHPTAFVDRADPECNHKVGSQKRDRILAPERMRGAGAVLLNDQGHRFVNELETRAVVAGAMLQLPNHTAWMVLPQHVAPQCGGDQVLGFYVAKGLMSKAANVQEAANFMNIPQDNLATQLSARDNINLSNTPPNGINKDTGFYIARVSPAIHYTMGGVSIDAEARVLDRNGVAIPGLYAAGEVAGGVHGRNRLAGNSLLECCVYGRRAGKNAASFAAIS